MKTIFQQISKLIWLKYWEGKWSFTTGYYFGWYYTNLLKKQIGEGLYLVVLISRNGRTACYFETKDREKFGKHLVRKALENENFILKFRKKLKNKADALVALSRKLMGKDINYQEFQDFFKLFFEYTGMHISPRHIIDYLPAEKAQKYFRRFTRRTVIH